ncbi:MAG: DEAD/DEAH box helicase, partial [Bacteriovoracaceae bacterium]|nr:DEAD/DEAH box helicase [Bacteriovoracaceae bacterium]
AIMPFTHFKAKFLGPCEKNKVLLALIKFLPTLLATQGEVCFAQLSAAAKNEINFLLEQEIEAPDVTAIKEKISYTDLPLHHGFYITHQNFLAISATDLFGLAALQKRKTAAAVASDVFAEQLASLQINDFVIHAQFGIGRYLGLQHLQTEHHRGDFLVIAYANQDKVYVPVYKMDLVQKHASGDAQIAVANLRQNKFAQAKKRAKAAAQALAFDLLKLQAQRLSTPAYAFSPPNHEDEQFALDFPFTLTEDQEQAIEQVYTSLAKPTAMDLLVCGDVGFGKTEVAMRAAFKVVQEHKQVAVLVPTTILAFQHFENFKQRFKNFAVQIDFLSRFKTAAQKAATLQALAEGKIDIIIGTHSLLSKKIKFADLGLVIVDEEHRFGVAHKEQLKLLKAHTHFLTLTATPIPRTLQLAFLKVKDLAVIQTPPPRRQSIKTFLLEEDAATLKSALQQELQRGGQIFWVHNRVQDIDATAHGVQELCPTAKIIVAHGQLREGELENRMRLFYQGKADILVCTTI